MKIFRLIINLIGFEFFLVYLVNIKVIKMIDEEVIQCKMVNYTNDR
jgi:hypothetical protein